MHCKCSHYWWALSIWLLLQIRCRSRLGGIRGRFVVAGWLLPDSVGWDTFCDILEEAHSAEYDFNSSGPGLIVFCPFKFRAAVKFYSVVRRGGPETSVMAVCMVVSDIVVFVFLSLGR